MNNTRQFQLIDGTFSKEDTLYIVLSLFNEKIAFHNRELLTSAVRNTVQNKPVEERLAVLHRTKAQVAAYLQSFEAGDIQFKVSGIIHISIADD
jgi:hypothetical protein